MWRDVFRSAVNPEVYLDADNLRALVAQAGWMVSDDTELGDISLVADAAVEAANAAEMALSGLVSSSPAPDIRAEILRTLLRQTAPMAFALGAWFQWLSAPGVFEDDTHLKILTLLADDVGVGAPERSRADAYRLLARGFGLTIYSGLPNDLASERSIRDGMFVLPAVLFAISRRPDAFAPELLGFDYAMRRVGLLPVWRVIRCTCAGQEWKRLDLSLANTAAIPVGSSPLSLSRLIAERLAADSAMGGRVIDGMTWARRGLALLHAELERAAAAVLDPALAVSHLVQERAREAAVYHKNFKLEGKGLDVWFREAETDPMALVTALSRSHLVRPGEPDRSFLTGPLVQPDGPMFRIFRSEDIAVIRRWIQALPDLVNQPEAAPGTPPPPHDRPVRTDVVPRRGPIRDGDPSIGKVPGSVRDAYHVLQRRALAPRTRQFALDYAHSWLRISRRSIGATARSLPDKWRPGLLRCWLLDTHDKHAQEFEEAEHDGLPTREEVIDQAVQLAPLTLIDGSWLQGFNDVTLAASRTGAPLFETYWDELGNGELEINHPKIYRDLLISMGVYLPPTGSVNFAQDPRLRDESFRLPVYWLCLGKLPVTLRPEILGLNLAMELSGVGGSYRSARRFLKHYGYSAQFAELHNAIDNVATGHSAWAADAIDAHMATISDLIDPDLEWERVRGGYESLAPIVKRSSELNYFRGSWFERNKSAAARAVHHQTVLS